MRTAEDVLRSLQKYVAEVLPDYEVGRWDDPGTFTWPWARVGFVGSPQYEGRVEWYTVQQPAVIHVWPAPGETVEESETRVAFAQDAIERAFRVGVGLAYPMRVPLYDYAGKTRAETSDIRNERDYITIVSFSPQRVEDAADPRNRGLAVDLRCAWRQVGRVRSATATVESVTMTGTGT